jgi:hypothetical protein
MVNQTNSQTQFLQLVCVVLVMVTLIGLVAAYILFRDVQNLEIEVAEAKSQADRFKTEILQTRKELDVLKSVMGYSLAEVGEEDSVEANTVVGMVHSDINRFVGSLPEATLRDAMIELHSRWQQTAIERNTLKSQLEKLATGSSTN